MAAADNLILGAYFAGKPHPQHGWSVPPASFDYFADWYHSILRLGLNAVLLHDHLPDKFTDKFTDWFRELGGTKKGGSFTFVRVEQGEFTAGDERFFHFRDYLRTDMPRNVFIVDVSDAWFHRNPFHLIERRSISDYLDVSGLAHALLIASRLRRDPFTRPRTLREWFASQRGALIERKSYRLFLGGEDGTIGNNPWMLKHYDRIYGRRFPELADKPVLNCGIIGGSGKDVSDLLEDVCAEMERLRVTGTLNDMAVFNRILYDPERGCGPVYSNRTLNSPWKRWRKSGTHAIFHK